MGMKMKRKNKKWGEEDLEMSLGITLKCYYDCVTLTTIYNTHCSLQYYIVQTGVTIIEQDFLFLQVKNL